MLRFVVLFLGLVAAFLVLGATNVAREHLHAPLSEAVAALVQTFNPDAPQSHMAVAYHDALARGSRDGVTTDQRLRR